MSKETNDLQTHLLVTIVRESDAPGAVDRPYRSFTTLAACDAPNDKPRVNLQTANLGLYFGVGLDLMGKTMGPAFIVRRVMTGELVSIGEVCKHCLPIVKKLEEGRLDAR